MHYGPLKYSHSSLPALAHGSLPEPGQGSADGQFDSFRIVGHGPNALVEFRLKGPVDATKSEYQRLNLESLRDRIDNLKKNGIDTSFEQMAMVSLQNAMRPAPGGPQQ